MQFSMLENQILSLKVVSVETEIVEPTHVESSSNARDEAIKAAMPSGSPLSSTTECKIEPSEPSSSQADKATPEDLEPVEPRFPVDSVLATVHVCYNAFEKYEHRTPGGEDVTSERTRTSNFTFRGCISNHAELNWMVWKFE